MVSMMQGVWKPAPFAAACRRLVGLSAECVVQKMVSREQTSSNGAFVHCVQKDSSDKFAVD